MPPTFLDVGSLDLFLSENLRFAQALATAGVSLELHVHPGAYHGFDQLRPGRSAPVRHGRNESSAAPRPSERSGLALTSPRVRIRPSRPREGDREIESATVRGADADAGADGRVSEQQQHCTS